MSLSLTCLAMARPGAGDALVTSEDRVLEFVSDHGPGTAAREEQRCRRAAAGDQLLEFPSAEALGDYMTDERRVALAGERDRAMARTQVIQVQLIRSDDLEC